MPSRKLALDPGGPKRLTVSWSGLWKNIAIHLDGAEVGSIPSKVELQQGRSFTLPDASILHVKLTQGFANVELQVTRDGRPLPGSASDPAEQVKQAGYIVYFIAGLSGVVGIAALFQVQILLEMGLDWTSLVGAAIYAPLGFFTLRRSKAALIIAIALFILDGIVTLGWAMTAARSPSIGPIFMRVILILPMIRGVKAMTELKKSNLDEVKKVSG